MLEKDLEALRNALAEPTFEGLESDIWRKVAADKEASRLQQVVLACQAGVIAAVVVGGIALNGLAPREASASFGFDAFSLRGVPAPSTLLLGRKI